MRLKHLLNCAVKWRYIKDSPAKGLQTIKMSPGRVRYLAPEERAKLLTKAAQSLACISRLPYRPALDEESYAAFDGPM